MTRISDSYIQIANQGPTDSFEGLNPFRYDDLFLFTWGSPRTGRVEVETLTGDLYPYYQFSKEQFTISFPKLTLEQKNQLEALCLPASGLKHEVLYVTPKCTRWWSVFSSPLLHAEVNTDVNRVRKPVYIQDYKFTHWDGLADMFSAVLTCLET